MDMFKNSDEYLRISSVINPILFLPPILSKKLIEKNLSEREMVIYYAYCQSERLKNKFYKLEKEKIFNYLENLNLTFYESDKLDCLLQFLIDSDISLELKSLTKSIIIKHIKESRIKNILDIFNARIEEEIKNEIFNECNSEIKNIVSQYSIDKLIANITANSNCIPFYNLLIDEVNNKINNNQIENQSIIFEKIFKSDDISDHWVNYIFENTKQSLEKMISTMDITQLIKYSRTYSNQLIPLFTKEIFIQTQNMSNPKIIMYTIEESGIKSSDKLLIYRNNYEFITKYLESISFYELNEYLFYKEPLIKRLTIKTIIKNVKAKKLDILSLMKEYDYKYLTNVRNDIYKSLIPEIKESLNKNNTEIINHFIKHNIPFVFNENIFNLSNEEIEIIKPVINYISNPYIFITYFHDLDYFMKELNVEKKLIYQYYLNNSSNWINDVSTLIDNNKIIEFKHIYNKLESKIFDNNKNPLNNINNVFKLLNSYNKYPKLYLEICKQDNISKDQIEKIIFLLNNSFNFEIKSIEDFMNLDENFIEVLNKIVSNRDNYSFIEVKEIIMNLLFKVSLNDINKRLKIYGGVKNLELLKFNNRNVSNQEFVTKVNEMIVITKFMESISDIKTNFEMNSLIQNLILYYDNLKSKLSLFNNYDEKMRIIFEQDINLNLQSNDYNIDQDKSNKYDVDVLDYRKQSYSLLVHALSANEKVEDVVNGKSNGKNNFISLSAISERNQIFFNSKTIIFGYDYLPDNNFICSSIENMSTNSYLKNHSGEVSEIDRVQKGILNTSEGKDGCNSEILCYRDNLKPTSIIIPNGREPNQEEIRIAKKYNLKLIFTQNINSIIKNPIPKQNKNEIINNKVLIEEEKLFDKILTHPNPRRIAIITDLHGLYEPTLAVLESIRKQGITEIYSLGDNIGTGPNSKEVLELLEQYNVKSIAGNHELYVRLGVQEFKEHFNRTGGYKEAIKNSEWTKKQLTIKQINDISNIELYPKSRTIFLGGKKILLCHYTKKFNSDITWVNEKEYDQIYQGHVHFQSQNGNIKTLKGLGIGGDYLRGNYLVLTETENGFKEESTLVPYDYENLKNSINESTLNEFDKDKICQWTGLRK